MCVIAGIGPQSDVCGSLVMSNPGLVYMVDKKPCLLPLDWLGASQLVCGLYQAQARGRLPQVAVCFLFHASRERLCLHGTAEMLASPPYLGASSTQRDKLWMRLRVSQSFFHCPKYIRTSIDGLTCVSSSLWQLEDLMRDQSISAPVRTFLARRVLCFLCTVNQTGQCAINHRGGKVGFLLAQAPSPSSRGRVLLPDYEGNGAFEAMGNVLETGRAALVIPEYGSQLALCIAGRAQVVEMKDLTPSEHHRCTGAKRAIRLEVQWIEGQAGNWSDSLEYERERTRLYRLNDAHACAYPI